MTREQYKEAYERYKSGLKTTYIFRFTNIHTKESYTDKMYEYEIDGIYKSVLVSGKPFNGLLKGREDETRVDLENFYY